ncbi:MAG TPA: CAP domain-containing protein [Planctomycetota bacterium]|nr:CAP domain-containing protein [Planctomycetota bacterium]
MLLLSAACVVLLRAEDSPEPTSEETLLLEFVNRFRADPPADAQRMADYIKEHDSWLKENVDLDMFVKELKAAKPLAPLVFNLELINAARGHCRYMIQNELTHEQKQDKDGFTGKNFVERCKAAKYAGFARAENVFRDALGVWDGHLGFVVDHGDGPGGMQKDRGHRKILLMWDLKEIGIGIVTHGEKKFSITQVFGERQKVARRAGGVVYIDANSNGFYDIGEGVGGVKISASTGGGTETWASGAYAFGLENDRAVRLTAEFDGKTFSRDEKPGRANIKFDWALPADAAPKPKERSDKE